MAGAIFMTTQLARDYITRLKATYSFMVTVNANAIEYDYNGGQALVYCDNSPRADLEVYKLYLAIMHDKKSEFPTPESKMITRLGKKGENLFDDGYNLNAVSQPIVMLREKQHLRLVVTEMLKHVGGDVGRESLSLGNHKAAFEAVLSRIKETNVCVLDPGVKTLHEMVAKWAVLSINFESVLDNDNYELEMLTFMRDEVPEV